MNFQIQKIAYIFRNLQECFIRARDLAQWFRHLLCKLKGPILTPGTKKKKSFVYTYHKAFYLHNYKLWFSLYYSNGHLL